MDRRGGKQPVRLKLAVAAALAVAALGGCVAGPAYRAPGPPQVKAYTATALPEQTTAAPVDLGGAQRFVAGRKIPEEWWSLFHSRALDGLVRRALADSPTVAAAQAALLEARENLIAQSGGGLLPTVDADASVTRQKISGAGFGQSNARFRPFTLYNASVKVSYTLDVAGAERRGLEALEAQVDYQRFELEGAYLTLTANLVTTAVKEAQLRAQIRVTQEIVATEAKQLKVIEDQFRLGAVPRSGVLAQRAQIAQTQATLPPLEKALAQNRHALAALAGRFPAQTRALPEFSLADLKLPRELPVSLPSALARQRPDIRAAEALLHAASAQVGVATANLYPQITLSGSYGSESTETSNLFSPGATVWNLGAGLLQPLFHGGELRAKRRAAVDAYDQSLAQYRGTVLQAFRNVADALRALEADARALRSQADAEAAAADTAELTRRQFELGAVSYLSLLSAQRAQYQARLGLVQAQAARLADTAALFQSLGGGWWNRGAGPDPASPGR